MTGFYRPVYFKMFELVPRQTYLDYSDNLDILLQLFDNRLLWTADKLREHCGCPGLVNNWESGGDLQYRGWRPVEWYKAGAKPKHPLSLSQHCWGRALDINFSGAPSEDIRKDIIKYRDQVPAFQYITGIEMGVKWLHFDVGNRGKNLQTFYP